MFRAPGAGTAHALRRRQTTGRVFRISSSEFWNSRSGSGFQVSEFKFRFRVPVFGFRILGAGFRIPGVGFRVYISGCPSGGEEVEK